MLSVEPDTFTNNRLSLELLAEKPCSAVADIVFVFLQSHSFFRVSFLPLTGLF